MTDRDTALAMLAAVNPVADPAAIDVDELRTVIDRCEHEVSADRSANDRVTRGERRSREAVSSPRPTPALAFAVAFGLTVVAVVAAAFFGRDAGLAPSDERPVTTTTPITTTTFAVTTSGSLSMVKDIPYASEGEVDLTTSVFFPSEGEGPWPVIVVYAEYCTGCEADNTARILAMRGAVVFAPVWAIEDVSATEYVEGALFDRAACAVGLAQAVAPQFGGDPNRTIVMGDAGGEHPATWVAYGLERTSACPEPVRYPPVGLVVGAPQWLFHEDLWDQDFVSADAVALDTLDRFLNPERWHTADDLAVYLWATAYQGNNRILDGSDAEGWLAMRDSTGTLVADLEAVGAFDDGVMLLEDDARLMEARLRGAGIPVVTHYDETYLTTLSVKLYDEIWTFIDGRR
jgi:hypothetical protein